MSLFMRPAPPPEELAAGRVTVDLAALAKNWQRMAELAAPAEAGAVVKADGYGLGIGPVVETLVRAGCKTFFVALPEEGIRARAVAPDAVIYVLGGVLAGTESLLAAADLRPVLNSIEEAEAWATFRPSQKKPPVALHIDTGMHRLGLRVDAAMDLALRTDLLDAIAPALVMSHLANADDPTSAKNQEQREALQILAELFPGRPLSLANSAGIFLGRDYVFDLVRPGIALYGGRVSPSRPPLAPVVTLEARILQVREVAEGDTVGYGRGERVRRDSRIAVLGVGYADGYHRLAGSSDDRPGAFGYLRETYVPIVGRVSMDLITIDVTDVPGVAVGDWVELIGHQVPLDEVAAQAGTIGYEILTNLGRRYARRYVGE